MGLIIISIALLYGYFFFSKAYVKIDIKSTSNTTFKIYWARENQSFSEDRSASTRIRRGRHTYLLYIDDIKTIRRLRIDPTEKPAQVQIYRLEIKQPHVEPICFSKPADFNRLIPVHEIENIKNSPDGITVVASGMDPQIEVDIHPRLLRDGYFQEIVAFLIMVLILGYFFRNDPVRRVGISYVPYLLTFVAALILIMAGLSQYNKHPDEYVHVRAAIYYQDHWMPPKVCAPETVSTYSVYGVSRLNSYELVYFIAGKFSVLFDFLPVPAYIRLRFFNLCLFIILIAINIRRPKYSILFIPLLLSPQIWYIFSYFNSDAFSIFMAIIVSLQVIRPNSLLNRFLNHTGGRYFDFLPCFILGLLFAILLLSKKNYYFFILFILFILFFKVINKEYQEFWSFVKKTAAILLVSASLIGCRYALDVYVNGIDKAQKIADCREKLAKPAYKPSTSPENRMPGLYLKSKGVSLRDVLLTYRWGEKSFRSAFGVYGYTSISASTRYYHFPRIIGLIFLVFVLWSSFFKTDFQTKQVVMNAIICIALLMGAALWKSWTSDFQAQGRYFFPVIAIFGYLLYHIRDNLKISILNILVISMCFTSIYSFVFVGLQAIPK
jgi:hypothetical protein